MIASGMSLAGTSISMECSTTLSVPPRLMPGAVSWLTKGEVHKPVMQMVHNLQQRMK